MVPAHHPGDQQQQVLTGVESADSFPPGKMLDMPARRPECRDTPALHSPLLLRNKQSVVAASVWKCGSVEVWKCSVVECTLWTAGEMRVVGCFSKSASTGQRNLLHAYIHIIKVSGMYHFFYLVWFFSWKICTLTFFRHCLQSLFFVIIQSFSLPQGEFSNVSSNRLPVKTHSHIGCIC